MTSGITTELWTFRAEVRVGSADLRGMQVQAVDGGIGKVHDSVDLGSRAFLLVDTGPWIFGRTIKLPAGLVSAVDAEQGIVVVDCPKEQIKSAPEQEDGAVEDDAYDEALARHYAAPMPGDEPRLAPSSGLGDRAGIDSPDDDDEDDDHEPRAAEPLDRPLGASAGLTVDTPPVETTRDSAPSAPESGPASPESTPDSAEPTPASPEPTPTLSESARASEEPAVGSLEPGEGAGAFEPQATSTSPPAPETSRPSDTGAASAPVSARTPQAREVSPQDTPKKDEEPARERAPRRAKPRSQQQQAEKKTPAPAGKRRQTSSKQGSSSRQATRSEGRSSDARAKTSSDDMPIARYDSLTAAEVTARLRTLTQSELAKVERYEKRGQSRQTILSRVSSLREKEPWRGYDTATVSEVREKLTKANADRLTAVRDYERRHRDRSGVMDAVRRRIADK